MQEAFWTRMTKPCKATSTDFYVEYGDNIEGTGFADDENDPLGSSAWNLNKLPFSDQSSPIKLLQTPIPGVTTPMLYHGTLFSTFSWHIEDLYLNSINYHHVGACKTWYGVAAQHADAFEQVVQDEVLPLLMTHTVLVIAQPCKAEPASIRAFQNMPVSDAGVPQNVC